MAANSCNIRALSQVGGRRGPVKAVTDLSNAAFRHRFDSPETMRWMAATALAMCDGLGDSKTAQNARAKARAILGNAFRVLGDHAEAERHLDRALSAWALGTRCGKLGAEIAEFRASLFEAARQFPLAHAELDAAETFRRDRGLDLAKVWAQRANVFTYQGRVREALVEYRKVVRSGRDRTIVRGAVISAAFALTEAGHWSEAQDSLLLAREFLSGGPKGLVPKIRWVEARVAEESGATKGAERLYRQARRAFLRSRSLQEAALSTVDLAALLARQGRSLEAWSLAREAGTLLATLGGEEEALAAGLLARLTAERVAQDLSACTAALYPIRSALARRREN